MSSIILVDGRRDTAKNAILDGLEKQLKKSKLKFTRFNLELIDFLLGSSRLQQVKQKTTGEEIIIIDTRHILGLSHSFYTAKEIDDYKLLSTCLDIVKAALSPSAVIVIDSFDNSSVHKETRRGYLWEAEQRGYHVISSLGDAKATFDRLLSSLTPTNDKKAVPLKEVLESKQHKIKKAKGRR